jgi:arsenate reductase-like glutaredoxin family protein
MSTKSPTWKKMGLSLDTMTKKKAIDLMLEEPNLIKRPLLLAKGKAVFGFKPEQYDELLG